MVALALVIGLVVGAALGLLVSDRSANFEANGQLAIAPDSSIDSTLFNDPFGTDPSTFIQSELLQLNGRSLANTVRDRLNLTDDPNFSFSQNGDTAIVTVTASAPEAAQAAAIARTAVSSYRADRSSSLRTAINAAQARLNTRQQSIRRQIDDATGSSPTTTINALQTEYARLLAEGSTLQQDLSEVGSVVAQFQPIRTSVAGFSKPLAAIFGAVLGAVAALLALLGIRRLRQTVVMPEDLIAAGIAASLPPMPDARGRRGALRSRAAVGAMVRRFNDRYAGALLIVTGPSVGVGTSFIASTLARGFGKDGVLVTVPGASRRRDVTAGSYEDEIRRARATGLRVVVDAPSLDESDASIELLAHQGAVCVLVVGRGFSRQPDVLTAVQLLEGTDAEVVCALLNDVPVTLRRVWSSTTRRLRPRNRKFSGVDVVRTSSASRTIGPVSDPATDAFARAETTTFAVPNVEGLRQSVSQPVVAEAASVATVVEPASRSAETSPAVEQWSAPHLVEVPSARDDLIEDVEAEADSTSSDVADEPADDVIGVDLSSESVDDADISVEADGAVDDVDLTGGPADAFEQESVEEIDLVAEPESDAALVESEVEDVAAPVDALETDDAVASEEPVHVAAEELFVDELTVDEFDAATAADESSPVVVVEETEHDDASSASDDGVAALSEPAEPAVAEPDETVDVVADPVGEVDAVIEPVAAEASDVEVTDNALDLSSTYDATDTVSIADADGSSDTDDILDLSSTYDAPDTTDADADADADADDVVHPEIVDAADTAEAVEPAEAADTVEADIADADEADETVDIADTVEADVADAVDTADAVAAVDADDVVHPEIVDAADTAEAVEPADAADTLETDIADQADETIDASDTDVIEAVDTADAEEAIDTVDADIVDETDAVDAAEPVTPVEGVVEVPVETVDALDTDDVIELDDVEAIVEPVDVAVAAESRQDENARKDNARDEADDLAIGDEVASRHVPTPAKKRTARRRAKTRPVDELVDDLGIDDSEIDDFLDRSAEAKPAASRRGRRQHVIENHPSDDDAVDESGFEELGDIAPVDLSAASARPADADEVTDIADESTDDLAVGDDPSAYEDDSTTNESTTNENVPSEGTTADNIIADDTVTDDTVTDDEPSTEDEPAASAEQASENEDADADADRSGELELVAVAAVESAGTRRSGQSSRAQQDKRRRQVQHARRRQRRS